jgi:hypothetical protein
VADLDTLAIAQALADLDPGWGEPTGHPRAVLFRHADRRRCIVISAGREWVGVSVAGTGSTLYTLGPVLDAIHDAIWGPHGTAYLVYPPAARGAAAHLIGRVDGRDAFERRTPI